MPNKNTSANGYPFTEEAMKDTVTKLSLPSSPAESKEFLATLKQVHTAVRMVRGDAGISLARAAVEAGLIKWVTDAIIPIRAGRHGKPTEQESIELVADLVTLYSNDNIILGAVYDMLPFLVLRLEYPAKCPNVVEPSAIIFGTLAVAGPEAAAHVLLSGAPGVLLDRFATMKGFEDRYVSNETKEAAERRTEVTAWALGRLVLAESMPETRAAIGTIKSTPGKKWKAVSTAVDCASSLLAVDFAVQIMGSEEYSNSLRLQASWLLAATCGVPGTLHVHRNPDVIYTAVQQIVKCAVKRDSLGNDSPKREDCAALLRPSVRILACVSQGALFEFALTLLALGQSTVDSLRRALPLQLGPETTIEVELIERALETLPAYNPCDEARRGTPWMGDDLKSAGILACAA